MAMRDERLIRLAEEDNVLVLGATVPKGEPLELGDGAIQLAADLSLGHKIAARDIAEGETVVKYNFPIGVATAVIPRGAHVHVHNMRSDYTPTYVVPEAQ